MPLMELIYKKSKKGAVYAKTSKVQKSLPFSGCFMNFFRLDDNKKLRPLF